MNALRLLAAGMMVSVVTINVRAEEKPDNSKLLVGKWEATKSDGGLPVGTIVEFTKDGKLMIAMKGPDGKTMDISGTFKVDGDKFMIAMKLGDTESKKTITIKKISATELSTADEGGKMIDFKKVTPK